VRHTFRFKLRVNVAAGVAGTAVMLLFARELISLFLMGGGTEGDPALTMEEGLRYLAVMAVGLLPYAVSQVYASTLRETGETVFPMIAAVVAVVTNFVLNAVLIFGLLGAPAMGVAGAALATVISRFAELFVLLLRTHIKKDKHPFIKGAYRSLRVPRALFARIAVKGLPLMANEFFWAIAITMRNQCYSTRGLEVVAAQNISSTIFNLFSVIYMALGSAIAIVVGNLLGAGELEEAKDTDRKMMAFSVFCAVGMGALLAALSPLFPMLYNTEDAVRELATEMILIMAATMPFCAFANSAYFTLRSGGQVMITLLFDSVYLWGAVIPVTATLAYLSPLPILPLFIIGQGVESLKCIFGGILLRRGTWIRQLVADTEGEKAGK
jgi:putative MATE family efflux protein